MSAASSSHRAAAHGPAESGRLRAALATALSVGSAVGATRTLVRLLRLGRLGPVGGLIAGGQAVLAAVAAVRAVGRWRAARQARRAGAAR